MATKQANKKQPAAKQRAEQPDPLEHELRNPVTDVGPRPVVPPRAARITPQAALEALLLSWLCLRDFALWAFVQGVDPDVPLGTVDLSQMAVSVEQMNAMRGAMMHFAKQIAGKNDPAPVLRDAIDKVRRDNAPVFSMTVPSIPSAF
jgi:hypothetical protein